MLRLLDSDTLTIARNWVRQSASGLVRVKDVESLLDSIVVDAKAQYVAEMNERREK